MLSTYVNVWPDQADAPITVNRDYIPLLMGFGLIYFDYRHNRTHELHGYSGVTEQVITKFITMWEKAP